MDAKQRSDLTRAALNRLAKWRAVFAGWQLGTRPEDDPECDAVRDHREATLLHRVELTALTRLLLEKGVFTHEEFLDVMREEADTQSAVLAHRFPGFKATDDGMYIDVAIVRNTMRGWKP